MSEREVVLSIFIMVFVAFAVWSVVRGRRWEKYQAEAAQRSKAFLEAAAADKNRFEEGMTVSREHLQATKELLAEIKALRGDFNKNADRSA